jgi:hypothetical protein
MKSNYYLKILIVLSVSLLWISCSNKEEQKGGGESDDIEGVSTALEVGDVSAEPTIDSANYADWEVYTYRRIKIIYPPDHPHKSNLASIAAGYDTGIRTNAKFFGIGTPQETLTVYFYANYAKAVEMTGKHIPFVYDHAIHYWYPNHFGPSLMEYMLPYWYAGETRHQFLKHGMMALFDYTGRNYHEMVKSFEGDTMFVPLAQLVVDKNIDVHSERRQSAEAASFVDFIGYYYGMEAIQQIWVSTDDFETTIKRILDISVDELQEQWLDFVDIAVNTPKPPEKK